MDKLIGFAANFVGVRWAKLAVIAAIALVVVAVIGITISLWHARDQRIADDAVTLDRADISAQVYNRVLEADRAATANEREQAAVDQQNDREVDDAVRNGTSANAGPGVASVIERVRQQQAAGRR